jgi:hypothetical protein
MCIGQIFFSRSQGKSAFLAQVVICMVRCIDCIVS